MKLLLVLSILSLLVLSACSTHTKYENFRELETTSTITVTCNRPYELTQDCSNILGAQRKITLNGLKLGVFANQKGDVVGVMTRSVWVSGFKKFHTLGLMNDNKMLDDALTQIRAVLEEHSIKITDTKLMKSLGSIDGFFLELDGDGYSVLKQFEEKDAG